MFPQEQTIIGGLSGIELGWFWDTKILAYAIRGDRWGTLHSSPSLNNARILASTLSIGEFTPLLLMMYGFSEYYYTKI
jgi:hypothetical protein